MKYAYLKTSEGDVLEYNTDKELKEITYTEWDDKTGKFIKKKTIKVVKQW